MVGGWFAVAVVVVVVVVSEYVESCSRVGEEAKMERGKPR